MQQKLKDFFKSYMSSESIFKNKEALSHSYIPDTILHRDEQISTLAKILAPCLRNEKPSNVFIYGTTGTGKSLVTRMILSELNSVSDGNVVSIYLNCKLRKISDTEYRVLSAILRELNYPVPETGLPTESLYNKFFEIIDSRKQIFIIALDELDALVKKIGDELLYNLTRINSELSNSRVCLIGISNDLSFVDDLDSRVKSSLSEEEVIFPPYDAMQLRDILWQRVKLALKDGVVSESVVAKCAAIAAQEQGDARRALDLLRVAAELVERDKKTKITEEYIDLADQKLDIDRVTELVKMQPRHTQLILYSIFKIFEKGNTEISTGDIFDEYQRLCMNNGFRMLTQRRISDLISELDMLGIITTKVISKGRYGRTRVIRLSIGKQPFDKLKKYFEDLYGV